MYKDENTTGFQGMILFVEIFTNVKHFGFQTFVRAYKLLVLYWNTWNHLTMINQISPGLFKIFVYKLCIFHIYMYK